MRKLVMILVMMLVMLAASNAETLVKTIFTSEYLEEPVVQTNRAELEDIELYVYELQPYFLDTKSKLTDKHAYWYDVYKVPLSILDDEHIWEDDDYAYITLVWERW